MGDRTLSAEPRRPRARALGLSFTGVTGPANAITDVPGVSVGYLTRIEGDSVRTGVTVILPRPQAAGPEPTRAGFHSFNGNGEMTGAHWIREAGYFSGPVCLTNTNAIGAVHEGALRWLVKAWPAAEGEHRWFLPVVAETWDGFLNDIESFPVRPDDVGAAIAAARTGPIAEGNVGGGAGMRSYGFKGGSGTASRVDPEGRWTVGAFVQANFGRRQDLTMRGLPIGRIYEAESSEAGTEAGGFGSIIIVIATDAPLSSAQLGGVARRGALGMARTGTSGQHESGDLFVAFSTVPFNTAASVPDAQLSEVFGLVVDAVEEAILNALCAAESMVGFRGRSAEAIDVGLVARLASRNGH